MAEDVTPRNLIAELEYRKAWGEYRMLLPENLLETASARRQELERQMDALQEQIATSPADPRWQRFIDTLPGYREFWNAFEQVGEEVAKILRRKAGGGEA